MYDVLFQMLAESLLNLDSNPITLIKYLHFRLFPDKSLRKHFVGVCFVEVGNFDLQACNLREKGTHLQRLLGIFEISEYPFFSEHFWKSICRGVFSLVSDLH